MGPVGSSVMLELVLAVHSYHVIAYPVIGKNLTLMYYCMIMPYCMIVYEYTAIFATYEYYMKRLSYETHVTFI